MPSTACVARSWDPEIKGGLARSPRQRKLSVRVATYVTKKVPALPPSREAAKTTNPVSPQGLADDGCIPESSLP